MQSLPTKGPDKRLVAIAASCASVVWLQVILFILIFVAVSVFTALVKHSSHISVSRAGLHVMGAFYGLFLLCGATYVAIAFSLYCPHCNFKFLVKPKGFGPRNFIYHPNCPRRWHLNPWAIQIVTFLQTRNMRCIKCGNEIFG
jgi:DNA-directed RNA polymerase subunit RPC12/RpoP